MGSRLQALSAEQRAYIAGFLDGDGCIAINVEKTKGMTLGRRVRTRVSFTQHYQRRQVLDTLKAWIGSGTIGEYRSHNGMAEYVVRDQEVIHVLISAIRPYLIVKQEHAALALAVIEMRKREGHTIFSLPLMIDAAIALRALNKYQKQQRLQLDPVTTEDLVSEMKVMLESDSLSSKSRASITRQLLAFERAG